MIKIEPFAAIRPVQDKVHLVASRSYVSYNRRALNEKLSENPYTFIHVINPEYNQKGRKSVGRSKYEKVKTRFLDFIKEGVYIQDAKPCIYLYTQTQQVPGGYSFSGWIAGASAADYLNQKIKVHEHTLTAREEMFKDYLDVTGFNAEPVLLSHPQNEELRNLKNELMMQRPEYDFTSTNKDRHQLWKLEDPEKIKQIQEQFAQFDALYIADGHHRSASSALLSQETNRPEAKNFLACFMEEQEMAIYDFNRLIRDSGGIDVEVFLRLIKRSLNIEESYLEEPCPAGGFKFYVPGQWYKAVFPSRENENPVEKLEAHKLSEYVLGPIFDVADLRTDKRVFFKGGKSGHLGLQDAVDAGEAEYAFALPPVKIEEIKAVADAGLCMPPKSTYIEPKLRSGLTIYPLESDLMKL